MSQQQFQVVSGPSKHELWAKTSLRLPIAFKLRDLGTLECIVNTIQFEDGSGHSWNIDGHITPATLYHPNKRLTQSTNGFQATFRTDRDRSGVFTITYKD